MSTPRLSKSRSAADIHFPINKGVKHANPVSAACLPHKRLRLSDVSGRPVETTEAGSSIVTKSLLSGFMGSLSDGLHPFLLRREKADTPSPLSFQIDFGTDFEEPYRYYATNLPSKTISKAAQFTISMFDEGLRSFQEHIYEVREIIDLLRHQSIDSL